MTALAELPEVTPDEEVMTRSWWRVSLRESLRYGRMKAGLAISAFVVLVAIVGPLFAPHSPTELIGVPFSGPSSHTLLGTDYVGEDVFSRMLWGGRYIVWMAFLAGTIGVVLGGALGIFAGYSRRWGDEAIMRSLDVLLAIPAVVFVLLFISMLGSSSFLISLLVGIAWMPSVARTIRAATLEIAHREFIEAAEVLGTPRRRILVNDILPNLMTIVLVEFGLRCAWSVGMVAAMSFLGFGIAPPRADWGLMVNENSIGLSQQPWAVVGPVVCIALFSIGIGLISDGLSRAVAGIDRATGA